MHVHTNMVNVLCCYSLYCVVIVVLCCYCLMSAICHSFPYSDAACRRTIAYAHADLCAPTSVRIAWTKKVIRPGIHAQVAISLKFEITMTNCCCRYCHPILTIAAHASLTALPPSSARASATAPGMVSSRGGRSTCSAQQVPTRQC